MLKIQRSDSSNPDFVELVAMLDGDLQNRDGKDHAFFRQFNKIDSLKHVAVAYMNGVPVGCGAIKQYDITTAEVKRMFVKPEMRGNGIAGEILKDLECWAVELGYEKTILETSVRQPEAIRLYQKNRYVVIPNYGQYIGVESSVCMLKELN